MKFTPVQLPIFFTCLTQTILLVNREDTLINGLTETTDSVDL